MCSPRKTKRMKFGYKTCKSTEKKLHGRVIAKKRENPAERLGTLGGSPVTAQNQTEERTRGNPITAAAQAASWKLLSR